MMLRYLVVIAIGWLTLGGAAYAQSTVAIGDAAAPVGGTATVPVTITGNGTDAATAIQINVVDANGAPANDLFSSITPDATCQGFSLCLVNGNQILIGIAGVAPIATINFNVAFALIAAPDETRFPVTFQITSPDNSAVAGTIGSITIAVATCSLTGTIPATLAGSTSAPAPITLTNTGPTELTSIVPALATGSNFAVGANTCTTPLAAGGTCAINVTFSPDVVGPFTDTLNVTGTASCSLALSANGLNAIPVGPFPTVTTGPLNFGSDTAPSTLSITVTNNDNAGPGEATQPLNFTAIPDATGLTSADGSFTFTGTTCPASLAAGASCTIDITFDPAFDGDTANVSTGSYLVSFANAADVTVALIGGAPGIPTLSEWAMIIMASLMIMLGAVTLRRNGYFK